MGALHWVVLAVILMAGLAFWNHQRSGAQLKALQEAGFIVSDELRGTPRLLLSRTQKQLAVLFPAGYFRADFAQVAGTELRFDSNAQVDHNYRLHLRLQGSPRASVEIAYENEVLANKALQQLDSLLAD